MTQTAQKNKNSSENPQPGIASTDANEVFETLSPLQELKFLSAMMADSKLPMTARVVGFRLVRWTNGKRDHRYHGYAWAGREKLAEWVGRDSKTTITTATKALEARGWIVTKRRRNETSLIRPNWSRADQEFQEVQKTVFREDQLSVLPEDQKTGPYSADRYRADPDRTDQGLSAPSSDDAKSTTPSSMGCCPSDSGLADDEERRGVDTFDLDPPAWLSEIPFPSNDDQPLATEPDESCEDAGQLQHPDRTDDKVPLIYRQPGLTDTFAALVDVFPDIERHRGAIEDHNDLNDQPTDLGTPESRRDAAWFQFLKLRKSGRMPSPEDLLRAAATYREYIDRSGEWPCTLAAWLAGERFEVALEAEAA
ncbi:hypothetical protein ACVSQB_23805 [Bradyrhizobium elkanii]